MRATADEIGMSYTAFRHFLKGGKPHPRTREKLVGWFVATRQSAAGIRKEDVAAAAQLMLAYINEGTSASDRERRRTEVIEALSDNRHDPRR